LANTGRYATSKAYWAFGPERIVTVNGRACAPPSTAGVVLRANGPFVCLAQADGLGIRTPKCTIGPTARPFACLA
jgi:hypothetical protein